MLMMVYKIIIHYSGILPLVKKRNKKAMKKSRASNVSIQRLVDSFNQSRHDYISKIVRSFIGKIEFKEKDAKSKKTPS